MNGNQRLIIRTAPDMKSWRFWVVNIPNNGAIPLYQTEEQSNHTTSTSTISTAIQAELPTLAT